jgi:hypothetical protein
MTLSLTLRNIATRPVECVVRRWNWKSALTSALVRAWIFCFANLTAGWRAAAGAMLAEYAYRGLTSGFYGALTQNFSRVQPAWQAALAAMICLPLCSHSLEFLLHWLRHTPHLKTSMIASVSFTAVSTLFHCYAMRQGAMIVGDNAASLGADMRRMPRILGGFLACGPLFLWRQVRSRVA